MLLLLDSLKSIDLMLTDMDSIRSTLDSQALEAAREWTIYTLRSLSYTCMKTWILKSYSSTYALNHICAPSGQ